MKEKIINKFNLSKLDIYCEIDLYIKDIIMEMSNYENIITVHSCEGHFKNNEWESTPYLAFLVNEKGWNIFWLDIAPNFLINNKSKVNINNYVDNGIDYSFIAIYGNKEKSYKKKFWNKIKKEFKKLK